LSKDIGKKILIVEDELALQNAAAITLSKKGYQVCRAISAPDAQKLLDTGNIDAIWLDHYLLGSETGFDFVERLRNTNEWKNIPIFVVTNSVSDDKTEKYRMLGVERYFIKSETRLSDIINDIGNYFEKKGNTNAR
jgi:DNA-binding response OmpR family regulator